MQMGRQRVHNLLGLAVASWRERDSHLSGAGQGGSALRPRDG